MPQELGGRRMNGRARVAAILLTLAVGGCGSTTAGSTGTTKSAAGTAATTASTPASSAATAPPSSGAPPAAAVTNSTAYGKNTCALLPAATIDSTIGVHVAAGIWDGHVCTWISKSPVGGATVGWIAPGSPQLAAAAAPSGSSIAGLGVKNAGRVQTGLPAPLAPSQAFLIIDLGHGGMTVHVSGPAVTLDEAATLAKDVLSG